MYKMNLESEVHRGPNLYYTWYTASLGNKEYAIGTKRWRQETKWFVQQPRKMSQRASRDNITNKSKLSCFPGVISSIPVMVIQLHTEYITDTKPSAVLAQASLIFTYWVARLEVFISRASVTNGKSFHAIPKISLKTHQVSKQGKKERELFYITWLQFQNWILDLICIFVIGSAGLYCLVIAVASICLVKVVSVSAREKLLLFWLSWCYFEAVRHAAKNCSHQSYSEILIYF